MNIALYTPDIGIKTKLPMFQNLALMKISAFYKQRGCSVEWYNTDKKYDKVYTSSVFTFSNKSKVPENSICGGSAFDFKLKLPLIIDSTKPDYTLYPNIKTDLGYLTRGCIRKCSTCIVPQIEGDIHPYRDIEQVIKRKDGVVLLDNNILASEYGIHQIEKIVKLKIRVDFNQGLDARLIDDSIAKLLSKVKWLSPLRMACDSLKMIEPIRKSTELLRWYNTVPSQFFVYVLLKDSLDDVIEIVRFLKGMRLDPFVQPYRDRNNTKPPKLHKRFARWVNWKPEFRKQTWEEYYKRMCEHLEE